MESFKKALDYIYLAVVLLYVLLTAVTVFGQATSIVLLNGPLCLWFKTNLKVISCTFCGIASLIGFLMSYLHGWESGNDG